MKLTYCKASRADTDQIFACSRDLVESYEDAGQIDFARVQAWMRRKLEIHLDEYTTVFADGEKVGFYRLFRNEEGLDELDVFFVLPPYRGRGIGSAVLAHCIVRTEGDLMLCVFTRNVRARAFYYRHGFEPFRTISTTRQLLLRKK